jgi:hypothetical protein
VIRGKLGKRIRLLALSTFWLWSAGGCISHVLKADNSQEILRSDEAESAYNIRELPAEAQTQISGAYVRLPGIAPISELPTQAGGTTVIVNNPPPPAPLPGSIAATGSPTDRPVGKAGRNRNKPLVGKRAKKRLAAEPVSVILAPSPAAALASTIAHVSDAREPSMEDAEGFSGRRPKVDPFRVAEKVVMEASYFGVVAGDISFEMRPFVEVNGHKSYHFVGTAKSTSVFAMFYAIDDWVETFVDFDTLVPYSYALHVKETKQLRESRSVFDWQKLRATFWDKKINSEKRVDNSKEEWDIPRFSQNVFSAPFYLRNFTFKVGKKIAFRVAHEKTNLVLTAEVVRKEHITTPAGEFDTVVLKPTIQLDGEFKPVGDIFLWFTDDDRKLIVRMESKIKIGKIVAVAKQIELASKPE